METCTFGLGAGMGKPIAERRQGVLYRAYCCCTVRMRDIRFRASARSTVCNGSIIPVRTGRNCPVSPCCSGEKSFPVMLTTFTCIHKETKEKIKYEDYKKLSDDEKKEYNVYPNMKVFRVFNVAQTNLQEARPELWKKLEEENVRPAIEGGEHFSFAPLDTMIKDNLWICPITPKHQDSAYYSITKNEIIVPGKRAVQIGRIVLWNAFPRDDALDRCGKCARPVQADFIRFSGICT